MTDFTAYLRLGVDSRDARQAQKDLYGMAQAGDKSEKSFKQLSGTSKVLGASIGGIGLAAATAQVIGYSDAWTNVENVLIGVSDSSAAYATTQAKVLALSKDTFSSLEGTAGLYAEITRSVSDLGINQDRVLGVTKTINNLFLAGGKAASETAGAIRQLNQGLAAGALRGDEFNSVAEGAPRILDALSQKLNISKGELREFAKTGGITAELLIDALEDYSDEAQKAVDTTTRTFSQSAEKAETFALQFVGASEGIKEFSATAGDALVVVAQNLDVVSDAVIVLSVAYGARLAGSLATATAAKVSSIAATKAQAIAENEAAVGIARRATVEAAAAKASLDKARADTLAATATLNIVRANGTATQSVAPLIAALNAQAVAQQKLTAAIGGSAAATAAANAANATLARTGAAVAGTTALATAARGLGGAVALLGGPAGVAILAGAALYYLATSATEAEETLDNLRDASGAASARISEMADSARAVAALDISSKLEGLIELRDGLQESIGPDSFFSKEYLTRTTEDIRLLNEEISKLQGQLDSIKPPVSQVQNFVETISSLNTVLDYFITGNGASKPFSLFDEGAGQVKAFGEEYTKLSAQIEMQIALFGDEKKSSELAYLARTGQLKEMSADEAALLVTRYQALEQLKETADKTKELEEAEESRAKSIASSIAELEKQNALFGDQSKYAEILYEIEAGLLKVNPLEEQRYLTAAKVNDQLNAQAEANKNLAASITSFGEKSAQDQKELDAWIESVDEFGGAWTRTGSIITDTFGSIADALNDYSARMAAIAKDEKKLAKERAKHAGDTTQIEKFAKKEKRIAEDRASATISGYADMAGAAASMFKEQSKGREALNKAEQVFTAIEIALALKKASANALTAITSAFSAPFPVNFAAGAAMIAIMAGLGVFGGGGGGGPSVASIQEKQGTGSVLGSDEKSESIANSFEEYSDIGLEQLAELRGIREGLLGLTGGINKLSVDVITSGLTGAKYIDFNAQMLGSILDSGRVSAHGSVWEYFGVKEMIAPLESQIVDIFGFIEDSVSASIMSLGLTAENDVLDFISDIGKVSFKDLSGEEIQSELNAIFSQQADLIAEFVVPAMKEYQQIGEGLFDTLTRVASEMATFKYFTNALGLDFNLTGLSAIAAQQAIAGFAGGMDKLTDNLQTYYEEFFTDEERAANQMKLLTAEMKNLGYDTVPTSRDAFRALVEGIDITTEAGQKQFAGLIALSDVFAELTDTVDDLAESSRSAAISMLERSVEAEKEIIGAQVALLNTSLTSSRAVFGALESSLKSMTVTSARTQALTRQQAQSQLSSMLSSARGGMLPNINDLNGALAELSRPSESLYSTFEEYATDLYRTAGEIRELKDIAGEQISTDELALSELQKQNEFLDEIVLWGREQVEILGGVDTRITSVADALNNLSAIIGVTYPTVEQQRVIVQMAETSAQTRNDLIVSQKATSEAITSQNNQLSKIVEFLKGSLLSITDSTNQTKKLLEGFEAIGIKLREETIVQIVDPIVDAVEEIEV